MGGWGACRNGKASVEWCGFFGEEGGLFAARWAEEHHGRLKLEGQG